MNDTPIKPCTNRYSSFYLKQSSSTPLPGLMHYASPGLAGLYLIVLYNDIVYNIKMLYEET